MRRTARGVGIGIVQLKSYALDEMRNIVCAAYDIRIGGRSGRADGHGPLVSMVSERESLALFFCQDGCGIPVNYRTEYTQAL
jgi:hypothetical protein